jgi:hypothetical protein
MYLVGFYKSGSPSLCDISQNSVDFSLWQKVVNAFLDAAS